MDRHSVLGAYCVLVLGLWSLALEQFHGVSQVCQLDRLRTIWQQARRSVDGGVDQHHLGKLQRSLVAALDQRMDGVGQVKSFPSIGFKVI